MDDLEVEERIRELKALQMRQDLVRVENTMLTEHLARVVVSRKGSMELHLEKAAEERENNGSDSTSRSSLSSRGSSPSSARSTVRFTAAAGPAVAPEAPVPMSMEEKCEIAEEECRFLEQHLDKMRSENERVLDDYRAILKQAKMAIAEVRKEKSDFYRDVLLLAQLNPANKSYSQDILSFIEEKLRKRVVVRNSIKAKNSSLQAEITELETQFASKKDLKDILHVVDFDQIKILNHELNSRTRERDNGIQSLKSVMKGSTKAMNETQKELTNAYDRGIELKNCLRDRVPVIKSAKENIVTEKSQRMKLHEAVLTAIQDQDGPVQPTAMDYMRTQDKAGKLWKDIRRWEVKQVFVFPGGSRDAYVSGTREELGIHAGCLGLKRRCQHVRVVKETDLKSVGFHPRRNIYTLSSPQGPQESSRHSLRPLWKRMSSKGRLPAIVAVAISLTVLVITRCNPSLGSSDCSTDTCCGQNGYCTGSNCCTTRKCLEYYAPPGYYDRDSHDHDHDQSLSGKKSFGWWVQAAAGLTGLILIVILICWFLSKCLSKF
ncbi:hypothetical protein SELMODRAFT_423095 [Selaginella moellendorffii]|uniref:Cilia- and flagella-associated protein 263 n=1 Tax=Selaginella moellendorffii TaxID=88036 RepID=D8SKJ8_SELML|nr:hypothetical protein SELMODRAFT_423095 [Selaginella moellendorffii]